MSSFLISSTTCCRSSVAVTPPSSPIRPPCVTQFPNNPSKLMTIAVTTLTTTSRVMPPWFCFGAPFPLGARP